MNRSKGPGFGRVTALGVLLTASAVALVAHAEEHRQTPGERAVEYRRGVYTVLAGNFGPVQAMAEGKMPFSAAAALKRAERAAQMAKMTDDAFPADSNGVGRTEAKPEIWKQPEEFQKQLQSLVEKTDALALAAKTGDQAKISATAKETAETCKSCHDKFKRRD